MVILIDSREKQRAIRKIVAEFDEQNIIHPTNKLYVGDYQNLDNPKVIVDRKQNLTEVCSNVCQGHTRFRNELIRAQEAGIKLIILVEHGKGITCLEDIIFWENPRLYKRKKIDGKWQTIKTKAMTGEKLYKVLNTMIYKYGIEFEFCEKKETGKKIIELLKGE